MYLHRLHLDLRCKEVRRDLADPYQMHSTLCRALSDPGKKCPEGEFLWRLQPASASTGEPRLLVQSRSLPKWTRIGVAGWFAQDPDPAIDLAARLKLDSLKAGQKFRFRLRANPCVTCNGKRQGLLRLDEQEYWIARKGKEQHGFILPLLTTGDVPGKERIDVQVSQAQMLRGRRHDGGEIRVFSVLFDGTLAVTDPVMFRSSLETGIGHAKTMGLGLLSVAPVT